MLRFWVICFTLWCGIGLTEAQPKIRFDHVKHDFGLVQESAGSVSYGFRFANQGSAPLILSDIRSSCDCTVPEWPREPIAPGKKGVIRVVFETTGNPGFFDKAVTVYSNIGQGSVKLRITGNVERSNLPQRPEFKHSMGGLRLAQRYLSMGEITHQQVATGELETYNPGKMPVKISFDRIPAHMEVLASPAVLQSGETGKIRVVYDASSKKDWGFVSDRFQLLVDGVRNQDFSVVVTADISEDFSRWTPQQKQRAPQLVLGRSNYALGTIAMNQKKNFSVSFKNSGRSSLLLRKVETGCECLSVVRFPSSVAAGATAEIICSFKGEMPLGRQQRTLTVRANDPVNPIQNVKIEVQVVE